MTDDEIRAAVSEQVVQSSETIENLRIEVVDLKAELDSHKETYDILSDRDAVRQLLASEQQMSVSPGLRSTPLFVAGMEAAAALAQKLIKNPAEADEVAIAIIEAAKEHANA